MNWSHSLATKISPRSFIVARHSVTQQKTFSQASGQIEVAMWPNPHQWHNVEVMVSTPWSGDKGMCPPVFS